MGKQYNISHISEAAVKEAWANYSKWDYYYSSEMEKSKKTLKDTVSSAKAKLSAKGVFEGEKLYQQEMERVTGIAQADYSSLQKAQEGLKSGAIKQLLTSGKVSKHSVGNYGGYLREKARRMTLAHKASYESIDPKTGEKVALNKRDIRNQDKWTFNEARSAFDLYTAESGKHETKTIAEAGVKGFEEYYTGVWGAYDPHFDEAAAAAEESTATAKSEAGSRAYKVAAQPKGQPGGGKPGNIFMQTPQEVAKEQAPQDEQEKAWWM